MPDPAQPQARAELRMLANWPYMLLIKVTLTVLSVMTLAHEFRDALAALGRNVVRRAQLGERIHGRRTTLMGLREP